MLFVNTETWSTISLQISRLSPQRIVRNLANLRLGFSKLSKSGEQCSSNIEIQILMQKILIKIYFGYQKYLHENFLGIALLNYQKG